MADEFSKLFQLEEQRNKVLIQIFENVRKAFDMVKKRAVHEIPNEALTESASTFSNYAAVRSNPGHGNFRMYNGAAEKRRVMERPVLKLSDLIRGKISSTRVTPQDEEAYKNGFKWKVVNTKEKGQKAFAYTKSLSEANVAKKIKSRGLLRAAWGINLLRVGGQIPRAIRNVISANPDIEKYSSVNDVRIQTENAGKYIVLENRAPVAYAYKASIVAQAHPYAERYLSRWLTTKGPFQRALKRYLESVPKQMMESYRLGLTVSNELNYLNQELMGGDMASTLPSVDSTINSWAEGNGMEWRINGGSIANGSFSIGIPGRSL